jgi:Xaa-Pro aminopeptidase
MERTVAYASEPIEPAFDEMLAAMGSASLDAATASRTAKYAEFPVDEYHARYAKARTLMEREGLDAILVTQDLNVRYFAGYLSILWCSRFRPYVALLPRDPSLGPTLIVPAQESGNANDTSWIADVATYPDQEDPSPYIAAAIHDKLPSGRIGIELGFGQRLGMTVNQFHALEANGENLEFVNGTPLIQTVRMVKSSAEVSCLRRACEISQAGVRAGWEALRPGMTEKELARVMGSTMYEHGAELGTQPSFLAMLSGPERYKTLNALASDRELAVGDLVMIDGGAVYGGYSTDFIRQACLGDPTDDQRKWFEICLEANDAAISAIRPGVSGADVYDAGVEVFKREGLMDFNVLNIVGHGTGMEVHELPWLGERNTVYTSSTTLQPGMVVCIEPVIGGMDGPDWRAGCFIVEDKVLVTETGSEVLTTDLPKDLWIQDVHVHA